MRELYLIHKELETLEQSMEDERLSRRAQVDQLKMQFEALKRALDASLPGFKEAFDHSYEEQRQHYDPEAS